MKERRNRPYQNNLTNRKMKTVTFFHLNLPLKKRRLYAFFVGDGALDVPRSLFQQLVISGRRGSEAKPRVLNNIPVDC